MKIIDGTIASPLGFSADGLHAGFKKKKLDFGWIVSEVPASVAGVYTTNKVIAAPLLVTKASIQKSQKLQAIVVNSGVANSCTGQQGLDDACEMQRLTAQKLKIEPNLVGLASTGVIGEQLPMNALKNGLSRILVSGKAEDFAEAILTTDTCTKTCVVTEEFGTDLVTMAGVAKGSGMIHPNMATMLAFITCDANISSATLQKALSQHVETTFNQITVDGDTSTNDMVLVMANGCRQNEEILPDTEEFEKFSKMLRYLMADLAKKIAKDGEGATKLIEVNVRHAKDEQSGRMIAKSVVGSSLVKTAIFGQDPNWGRILAAIGYAGADVSVDDIDIWIEGIPVMQASSPVAFDPEETSDAMAGELLTLTIDLHDGDAEAQAWGCDLSYDYVKINALYRRRNAMKDVIVIKIGGVAAQKLSTKFIKQMQAWIAAGKKIVVVHGGGLVINQLMKERQLPTRKVKGLRVTAKSDLPIIEQALLGQVGRTLTQELNDSDIESLQLVSHLGKTVSADFIDKDLYGYVGQVKAIQTAYLEQLLAADMVPVLASLGENDAGELLNINADYLAAAVASSLQAEKLILMTDIEGVLEDKKVLPQLLTSQVSKKIQTGVIKGGMIPKIESAVQTVLSGVGQVLIGDNLLTGTLIAEG